MSSGACVHSVSGFELKHACLWAAKNAITLCAIARVTMSVAYLRSQSEQKQIELCYRQCLGHFDVPPECCSKHIFQVTKVWGFSQ